MYEFLQVQAPPLITAILGSFTLAACLFWLMRRQEHVPGWLALVGGVWFLSGVAALRGGGLLPLLFLPPALLGFIASFGKLSGEGRPGLFLRRLASFLWTGTGGPHHFHGKVILASLAMTAICAVHDVARFYGNWAGLDFDLMPYAGLIVFSVFALLLTQRILDALSVVENLNLVLENRVRAANASLAASEAARRALEVSGAISKERDRLMREIHDGIGSSLVTAIAAAERRGQSVDGVTLLRRALTDLRVAVDSLEPVQGDIATLMASLRYRVEPDLKKAGIGFDWRVEPVPEIDWLDSVNALHVLRIFQEAFGNILGHAEATKISVICREETREGRQGVLIEVADNGKGYSGTDGSRGHGLKNMASRADALAAQLTQVSSAGRGSTVALWLPTSKQDN
jgi:signal transduction histidine kinase